MNKTNIKKLIKLLGFQPEEAKENIYIKNYNGYALRVDFNEEKIEYGEKITLGDLTTSNFSSSENFVVLECVNRLLEKGYAPEKLTLEIKWDLGRKEKGKLDIYVADKDDDTKCFLMIECKTAGSEYNKEKKNMLAKGGQLFSYFQQDKSAQYLCLYASELNGNSIAYDNAIVEVIEDYRAASNKNETYSLWNKIFKDNGIFEDWVDTYNFESKAMLRSQLKPLQQSDSGFIFNRFAEILRHNIVSDKSNAFNKIFNLFLCKIEDEDKSPNTELAFQWKEDDDHISLQIRLNDLYKEGMRKFLNIEVTDFNESDLGKELSSLSGISKKHVEDMFTKLRLYKNNEFAFKEVFDDASFEENANVLKEVVELLQSYQLRYTHKQQFLGDFFELLLNTGLKQESGQFFTPVPIARFISTCIPLEEIITDKIESNEVDFLPYVMDYAAGSGHFLTEAMDEIQHVVNRLDHDIYKDSVKRKLRSYKEDTYAWAEEFIYGIEKDYRLVKTAKVACFLNGDGLANLIHADGLDSFEHSSDYDKKLKHFTAGNSKNNHQFDVIVANPPYSVSAFKNTLKNGNKSFDLYDRLTEQSSEIECLFIERTKQLLKEGAYAGVVLPSSILSNSGIYIDTREIILKYFEVIGITEFGSNTFMATGTSTVTLFLKKREENHWLRVKDSVNEFMERFRDITCNGIDKAFSKYCYEVYEGMDFDQYLFLITAGMIGEGNEDTLEILNDYDKLYKKTSEYKSLILNRTFKDMDQEEKNEELMSRLSSFIKNKESDKLLYFMLSYEQQVVLVKSGEKKVEKDFLGYDFSNRRGHEGIKMYLDSEDKPTTKLYDTDNPLNPDKVNSYIYRAFLGEKLSNDTIAEGLQEHVYIKSLHEMIGFDKIDFTKEISPSIKKKIVIQTQWETKKLGELIDIEYGTRIVKKNEEGTQYPVYGGGGEAFKSDTYNRENSFIISRFGMSPYCMRYVNEKFFLNDSGLTIKSKSDIINIDYLHNYLYKNQEHIYLCGRGVAQKNIDIEQLKLLKIPVPPIEVQEEIIRDINFNQEKQDSLNSEIDFETNKIETEYIKGGEGSKEVKLGNIHKLLKRGKSTKYGNSSIQIIKSGQARGYKKFDFSEKHYVVKSFVSDERNLERGDILINSSGVGTAGRVTLFDLKGEFVVDSHVSILRLDPSKAIPKYVLYALANIGFKTIEAMAKGQSGQIELTLPTIESIKIPLPSLSKQKEIVNSIEAIEKTIEVMKEEVNLLKDQENEILENSL